MKEKKIDQIDGKTQSKNSGWLVPEVKEIKIIAYLNGDNTIQR